MTTKKAMQAEMDSLRCTLFQERQDHADHVHKLQHTAYEIACDRMRVKMVVLKRADGVLVALQVDSIEVSCNGSTVYVLP